MFSLSPNLRGYFDCLRAIDLRVDLCDIDSGVAEQELRALEAKVASELRGGIVPEPMGAPLIDTRGLTSSVDRPPVAGDGVVVARSPLRSITAIGARTVSA